MTIAKIFELRDDIAEHLVQRRKALEQEIAQLDGYAQGGRRATGTKRSPMKGTKVKPKYRGPDGQSWSGRGVHPRWLAPLLKEGRKIDEFRIGGAKPAVAAAAHKKIARKVGRKPARKARKVKKKG